jgi:hypothetical protein
LKALSSGEQCGEGQEGEIGTGRDFVLCVNSEHLQVSLQYMSVVGTMPCEFLNILRDVWTAVYIGNKQLALGNQWKFRRGSASLAVYYTRQSWLCFSCGKGVPELEDPFKSLKSP